MREREIPEILMKCCGKIYKPHNIKILEGCVKISFFCPICRNWVYLENRNGMKKIISNTNSDQLDKILPFKYIKGDAKNGQKRNKKTIK